MEDNSLAIKLDKASSLVKSSKERKLLSPKLVFSKILQILAQKTGKSIRVHTKLFFGDEMLVVIPEQVSMYIYRYGFCEEGLTRFMIEHLKPGATFLDIGAHFGCITLLASHLVGRKGSVHSFEPTPSTFEILKENTAQKHNVTLNNNAAFSTRKPVAINDYGVEYSAFNSVFNPRLPQEFKSKLKPKLHQIEAVCIDEYVETNHIKPNFIKIDAESCEYEILRGMKQTIKNFHPLIATEVGDYEIEGVPSSKELILFLKEQGYSPYDFRYGKIQEHTLKEEQYGYENILFLPKIAS